MNALARHICLLVIACGMAASLQGQRSGIEVAAGMHLARMDDMKYLQDLYLENYPVEAAKISSYPPYYRASIGYRHQLYPTFQLGFHFAYNSTGARINYTDYSGSMSSDFNMRSNRLTAMASYAILGEKWAVLSAYGKAGVNYSLAEISTVIQTYSGYTDITNNYFHAFSPVLVGGLELFFHLETLSFGMDAGYMADIAGDLKYSDNGDPFLDPSDRERTLTSDWTGWQLQLKFILWL